ncbi:MAG: hypothetical protein MAG451_00578 [Anaerolineales bacterium]|nr:hypothetical protein [Anaerolineales bacterium]
MAELFDNVVTTAVQNQEQAAEVMNKLLSVAHADSVFAEPVAAGDYTIITASEVSVGAGFGFGLGGGSGSEPATGDGAPGEGSGVGGGGGGGGASMGRPVAVISVGPDGVQVEPVVDPTKIALAFLTMLGSIFVMGRKIRQAAKS